MIRLDSVHPVPVKVEIGDVLMVAREMDDRDRPGRTFMWRFFALVVTKPRRRMYQVLILDEKEREPIMLALADSRNTVHYLPPEEWPDGVHALRARTILEGRVDAIF